MGEKLTKIAFSKTRTITFFSFGTLCKNDQFWYIFNNFNNTMFLKVNFSQFLKPPPNQFKKFWHTALLGPLPNQYQFTFSE